MFNGSVVVYGKSKDTNFKIAIEYAVKLLGEHNRAYIIDGCFPDCMVARPDKKSEEIHIEQTRNIVDFFSKCSDLGLWKVAIIDEAEKMNKSAANSMLKTMEELPPKSLIILTTNQFFALLPTVRSRCYKLFVQGAIEDKVSYDDAFLKKCLNFLNSSSKDIVPFVKNVPVDKVNMFLDIVLNYAYNKFMASLTWHDAENYLKLSTIVWQSKNTHLDPQNLMTACCLYVKI
jgi:replication-associated recombination protein RarA